MDFQERPRLVFWEMTRACPLACIHCRASAIADPLPGELTTAEGRAFLDRLLDFGRPLPIVILTGGDPLLRPDLFELIDHARRLGLPVAVSPAVSERLSPTTLRRLHELGVSAISISLDGGLPATHERIRRSPGHFDRTLQAIRAGIEAGLKVQVNSTVMRANAGELPRLFDTIFEQGVRTWEVFFLIRTGRGIHLDELTPEESEDVGHFLYDASRYGAGIRAVEAPFLRRILRERDGPTAERGGPLYGRLRRELEERMGPGSRPSSLAPQGTLDGDGTLFIGYDGTIFPGGFVGYRLGNVREQSPIERYRESDLLRRIRSRELHGACGSCPHRRACGGSRARAYAATGDPLGSDPACAFADNLAARA